MADDTEPDEYDLKIARARRKMDAGRAELLAAISEALAIGHRPSRVGRYARWSRDYIVKIRDGKLSGRSHGPAAGKPDVAQPE